MLRDKAKNFFIIGTIAEMLGMHSEAATNYFKALFALDDAILFELTQLKPKDHTERFEMLRKNAPFLYFITDRPFSSYRRTYTKELTKKELSLIKKRILEAFKNAKISIPTTEEIRKKFEELSKKRKLFS